MDEWSRRNTSTYCTSYNQGSGGKMFSEINWFALTASNILTFPFLCSDPKTMLFNWLLQKYTECYFYTGCMYAQYNSGFGKLFDPAAVLALTRSDPRSWNFTVYAPTYSYEMAHNNLRDSY